MSPVVGVSFPNWLILCVMLGLGSLVRVYSDYRWKDFLRHLYRILEVAHLLLLAWISGSFYVSCKLPERRFDIPPLMA
jgi:hypothetical protein